MTVLPHKVNRCQKPVDSEEYQLATCPIIQAHINFPISVC